MKRKRLLALFVFLSLITIYTGLKLAVLTPGHTTIAFVGAPLLISVMVGWMIVYRVRPEVYDALWYRIFAWTGSILFGAWACFMLFAVPFDFAIIALDILGIDKDIVFSLQFFGFQIISVVTCFIVVIGFFQAISGPKLREIRLKVPNLAESLKGISIVQISDLHIGATIRRRYVSNVVSKVNALKPDFIAITGDLVDGSVDLLKNELAPLKDLRGKYGVFFATGNHDYYSGALEWIAKLSELGYFPLLNENKIISIGSHKLMIAGVTDPTGRHFVEEHHGNIQHAIRATESCDLKILLAHQPNACFEASKAGFDIQLSGHTHSGQFFPFSLLVGIAHKYYRGLNLHDKLWVYVNPGTGYWGPPLRFMVPSEITRIVLE